MTAAETPQERSLRWERERLNYEGRTKKGLPVGDEREGLLNTDGPELAVEEEAIRTAKFNQEELPRIYAKTLVLLHESEARLRQLTQELQRETARAREAAQELTRRGRRERRRITELEAERGLVPMVMAEIVRLIEAKEYDAAVATAEEFSQAVLSTSKEETPR